MIKSALLIFVLGIYSLTGFSQCNTNVTICTPGVAGPFNFAAGSPNPSSCLDYWNGQAAPTYAYIVLYITQSGNLNLLINGDQAVGCLDVAIFDVTGQANPCASLSLATEIGCNYASDCDGCNEFGSNFPCLSEVPAPIVTAGDVLMILVEDWNDVMTSFTLELSNAPGSAQTGPPPPDINPVGPLCDNGAAVQLTAATGGGTWSGTGVTPTGMFNPTTAGAGTHTITYNVGTAPCNSSDQVDITVIPCGCTITSVSAIPGPCNGATNQFQVTGQVAFTIPPVGGTLIVQDCNGNQVTYPAPFVSPINYTLSNLPADGTAGCAITATFSNDVACTLASAPYNNPPGCICSVNAGPDQAVCAGTAVTLSASGNINYVWDNGVVDGVPFNAMATTTYTVTSTDANGCVSTDQVTITVNPSPIVNAGVDQTVCDGIPVTLSAPAGETYTWNNGVVEDVPFNAPIGTTTYTASLTGPNGCVGTDQVNITVNPIPVVNAGPDQTICDGMSTTLNGSGATTYVWDNGVVNNVPFTPALGSLVYTVVGDANGCTNTDDLTINVVTAPVVSFNADVLSGCEPLTVTFTNTSGAGFANCTWDFGNGTTSSNCGSATTTFIAGTYDISLSVTSGNGCTGTETYTDYIYVESAPNVSFIPSSQQLSLLNTTVYFVNTTTGAVSYEWDFGDGSATSTNQNTSHTYPNDAAGSYLVNLTAVSPLGCIDSFQMYIATQEELIYYIPNTFTPDGDEFNQSFQPIFSSGYDPYDFTMTIFNRWGEVIFESHDVTKGWDGTYGGQKMVQTGTYTWKIEVKTSATDERVTATGHVTILK